MHGCRVCMQCRVGAPAFVTVYLQGAFDLVCIGVGLMLGAGVFVTTGQVAVEHTG